MDRIFCLSHCDWEEYSPFLVSHSSKTEDEWKQDAIDAMNSAAENIVSSHEKDSWIGSYDIVKKAIDLLLNKGYERVVPIESKMRGSGIIENDRDIDYNIDDNIKQRIFSHNIALDKKLDEELNIEAVT